MTFCKFEHFLFPVKSSYVPKRFHFITFNHHFCNVLVFYLFLSTLKLSDTSSMTFMGCNLLRRKNATSIKGLIEAIFLHLHVYKLWFRKKNRKSAIIAKYLFLIGSWAMKYDFAQFQWTCNFK